MANLPQPINANNLEELKKQVTRLMKDLYEDRIGGAELGDVFGMSGDVLALNLSSTSGMAKSGGYLGVLPDPNGGLQTSADGLKVKLADSSLALSSSGLRATGTAPIVIPLGEPAAPTAGVSLFYRTSGTTPTKLVEFCCKFEGGAIAVLASTYV